MKQKLRILTLSFLLVMQSFFGITPAVFAEDGEEGYDDAIVVVDEENNGGNEAEEGTEEGDMKSKIGEEEGGSDEGKATEEDEPVAGKTIGENNNQPLFSTEGTLFSAQASEMDHDVTLGFVKLVVNGTEITNPDEAYSVEPKLGDNVSVHYSFKIDPKQDYGVGSTFKFDLPPALLNFQPSSLSGNLTFEEVKFSYTTTDKTVTVTLDEGTVEESTPYGGTLNFFAKFDSNGAKDGLEQELVIPIAGGEPLIFPFTFKPTSTEKSMSKTGTASIENGERYIDWTVWTNREGANLQNATLNDNPESGHELAGNITVEKFPVELSGLGTSQGETTKTEFPVNLDNGRYAYKLTYKTKVTREPKSETEVFMNRATLTNGSNTDNVTASVSHTYGKKLAKSVTDRNKYNAKWKIEYNYFGSKMNNQQLTDEVSGTHKINKESIKVYNVTVDAAGNGTKGTLVAPQPTATLSDDEKTFTINLDSPNGEAYLIEYETVFDGEYVTTNSTVDNTASYDNEKIADTDGFSISEGIFSKSRGEIDYVNKEITWKIHVNVEQDMNNFVIEDDFENYGGENGGTRQKLVNPSNNPFVISSGVNVSTLTLKGTNGDEGFILNFGNLTKGTNFTITYKTKFDILPNGTAYTEYKNTAEAKWESPIDDKQYNLTKSATFTPSGSTSNNGYKNGSFDHVNQVFNWKLAVNINKQDINGATLVDVIGEGHELVPETIKIHQLNLGVNDQTGTSGAELKTGHTITLNPDKKGFSIDFNNLTIEQKNQAYIVTYQTKDSDNIIGKTNGSGTYGNTATFTTPNSGSFTLPASATVQHANELIAKDAKTNSADETITWTVDVNKSHSALDEITLTDKMSENQLILPDTFKMREIKMDAEGKISYGAWESITPEINSTENSFTLSLGELNKKGYQIEYKTFFLGGDGETFSNEASLSYTGATTGTSKEANKTDVPFNFNDSSGTITSKKGKLELHKVGLNPLTGEQVNLEGIKFHLLNKTGTIKIAEATTDSNGKLTFEDVRYGKYLLEEQGTPTGYKELGKFEITMNDEINFEDNGGKAYVVENIEDVDVTNGCTEFTLTLKDVDGDPRIGVEVKLVNKNTGKEVKATTNTQGQVIIERDKLSAGPYEVFEIGTGGKLGDVVVSYDGCKDELIQPEPSCTLFTITIEDKDNIARPGVTVTLKHKTDSTAPEIIATTDENGQFTVPSTTQTGVYKVYEGKQYLGDVTITYKNTPCEAIVSEAPTCESFTLIVKDVDGKPREAGVKITIKDKDGNTKATGTTDQEGKVTTNYLAAGEYDVFEGSSTEPFAEFTTNTQCGAEVQPKPSCPVFVITVNDENGNPRSNLDITVKDESGKPFAAGKTEADGTFEVPSKDLPAGTYEVFEGSFLIGVVNVSYLNSCEAAINPDSAPKCPNFTLEVQDRRGNPQANIEVTVKDKDGKIVATGTTDDEGKVTFPNTIEKGTYRVYDENNKLIRSFTVKDECKATVKPSSGGGGGTPPEPEEPIDPNKPIDPEDPNKPIDPDKPVDPEDPNKLDPNKPIDPNNPNKPDPNKPIDPNNPNQPGKVGSGGDKNDPQGNKGSNVLGGSDSNDKNSSTGSGEKLPQTGEERNLNLLISGILAIVLGALLIAFRRKTKES